MSTSKLVWDNQGDHCEATLDADWNFQVWILPRPTPNTEIFPEEDHHYLYFERMCRVLFSLISINTGDSTWDGVKLLRYVRVPIYQEEDAIGRSTFSISGSAADLMGARALYLESEEAAKS